MIFIIINMKKYNLNDFNYINESHTINLSKEIINKINLLAKKVGAPNYKKTPIFKKPWKNEKKFKNTVLKKNELTTDNIIRLLNKLTKNNYSIIKKEIIENMTMIIKNDKTNKKMEEICVIIFNIASKNKFWCEIYAELCSYLINKFPTMKKICENNFNNLLNLFSRIRIHTGEDYELLCKINEENEKRKSICSFFVYLMKFKIIKEEKIIYIINELISIFKKNINNKDFKNENFEICENLCILIKESLNIIKNQNEVKNIKEFIDFIINLNIKDHYGISSKTYFRFLDVFE